ncbi:MAG TPA: rod shape-determining protein MreD [Solibacterales bacterium]|nr:rod shape-determining protein MreD [Bryobacterales bacterium]
MTDLSEHILLDSPRRTRSFRYRPAVLILIPLAAILFQVYVPKFVPALSYLDLPLLVTVYFSLMRRKPITGSLIGAAIGLVQDSLSHQPLGMFGIVKTLVGYFSASVSLRFDVDNYALRFFLSLFFFAFHQFFYWVMTRALLNQMVDFDYTQAGIFGLLNAIVSLPLFAVLDKLKETA